MTWAVFCDFDGTVATVDTTDALLERYAEPAWREVEQLWVDGKIGSKECMRRQVELVRATARQLDAFADHIAIDEGFPAFVRACERRSVPVAVLSDGLDYVIRRVLARHALGFLPVFANHLKPLGDDRYTLLAPYAAPECSAGTCKCAIMGRSASRATLLIGDGRSDFCAAAKSADLVLAKDRLLRHCEQHDIAHFAFDGFLHARTLLEMHLDSPPARTAAAIPDLADAIPHEP